ncbi:MAG: hypothetical protein ACI8ZM_001041 [Crocinitomix sp.]|jgi:hypothetical protein
MRAFIGGGLGAESEVLNTFKSELKIDYFDPDTLPNDFHSFKIAKVEWTSCEYCVYLISPLMRGFDQIVNVVDDSNKRPTKTVYCFLLEDNGGKFTEHQVKSLKAIGEIVKKNGAFWFESMADVTEFLNKSGAET